MSKLLYGVSLMGAAVMFSWGCEVITSRSQADSSKTESTWRPYQRESVHTEVCTSTESLTVAWNSESNAEFCTSNCGVVPKHVFRDLREGCLTWKVRSPFGQVAFVDAFYSGSSHEIWAITADPSRIYRYDMNSNQKWEVIATTFRGSDGYSFSKIHGSNGVFWIISEAGDIFYWDGLPSTSLKLQSHRTNTGARLFGLRSFGPRHAYAVGENATILHFDGSSWTKEYIAEEAISTTGSRDLRGILAEPTYLIAYGPELSLFIKHNGTNRNWFQGAVGGVDLAVHDVGTDRVWFMLKNKREAIAEYNFEDPNSFRHSLEGLPCYDQNLGLTTGASYEDGSISFASRPGAIIRWDGSKLECLETKARCPIVAIDNGIAVSNCGEFLKLEGAWDCSDYEICTLRDKKQDTFRCSIIEGTEAGLSDAKGSGDWCLLHEEYYKNYMIRANQVRLEFPWTFTYEDTDFEISYLLDKYFWGCCRHTNAFVEDSTAKLDNCLPFGNSALTPKLSFEYVSSPACKSDKLKLLVRNFNPNNSGHWSTYNEIFLPGRSYEVRLGDFASNTLFYSLGATSPEFIFEYLFRFPSTGLFDEQIPTQECITSSIRNLTIGLDPKEVEQTLEYASKQVFPLILDNLNDKMLIHNMLINEFEGAKCWALDIVNNAIASLEKLVPADRDILQYLLEVVSKAPSNDEERKARRLYAPYYNMVLNSLTKAQGKGAFSAEQITPYGDVYRYFAANLSNTEKLCEKTPCLTKVDRTCFNNYDSGKKKQGIENAEAYNRYLDLLSDAQTTAWALVLAGHMDQSWAVSNYSLMVYGTN